MIIIGGRFNEIINIINFDITGIKNEIIELIKGNEISIELRKFDADELQKEYKGDDRGENNDTIRRSLFSKMVVFGFLTYYNKKISIPNEELKEHFIEALGSNDDMKYYYDIITKFKCNVRSNFKKNA